MFQLRKSKKIKLSPVDACQNTIKTVAGKNILSVNCMECLSNASLNNAMCREGLLKAITRLSKEDIDRMVLKKPFHRVYNRNIVEMMGELGQAIKTLSPEGLCSSCKEAMESVWGDTLYTYYKLSDCRKCGKSAKKVLDVLGRTAFIRAALKFSDKAGAYSNILRPVLIPDVITSHVENMPPNTKPVDEYAVGDVKIIIHSNPDRVDMGYFVLYPEFSMSSQEVRLLNEVFEELVRHKPDISFEPDAVRREFSRVIEDILDKKAGKTKGIKKERMMSILLRHTVGYGIIEPIMADEHVQDLFVDSGTSLVHIVHSEFGECTTNIVMAEEEIEKLSSRLMANSGRPFDASTPVLHTELEEFGVRVCGICQPSTYKGTGFAFRRRKTEPWTLSELISKGMMDAKTAGLLSFLVDSQSSFLITGPRSSGKTSLLTALMLEIPQNIRVILIEDTPEIPVQKMKNMGFKVEHLRTEAFAKGFELSAEDALRTSLRLGDSVLVLGEVRGPEAKSLFEAMRIGATGNVVFGTIHGSSAMDTWDRVVNDLGVPSTSFKAVDLVVSAGTIRFGDDVKRHRRLVDISEVLPGWKNEPKFRSLVQYNRNRDAWKTGAKSVKLKKAALHRGISEKKVRESIAVRSRMKQDLVNMAMKLKRPEIMGPKWTVAANTKFFVLASGTDNYMNVYKEWSRWLKKELLKGDS